MKCLWQIGLGLWICWSSWALADTPPTFQAGKDYQILTPTLNATATTPTSPPGQITVIEFFSYGCPWCFKTEPALETWLKTKPSDVRFSRVPVVFESNWKILARAYYVANALGVENKVTATLFDALHKQGLTVNNAQILENFFVQQGVSKQTFESAFNASPAIDADMARGDALMRQYQVTAIPRFVINGQYATDLTMTGGDPQKLLHVVEYLVKKSQPASVQTKAA